MPLPKNNAEAGRVRLYCGHFYFTAFTCTSQGAEAGNGAEEKEANGACWETQHHIRKRNQSFPTPRGQAKSQRASKLRRLDGVRQQAPSTWRWDRDCARDLNSHGRTSCCRQSANWTTRGWAMCATVLAGPVAQSQTSGTLKPTTMDSDPSEKVSQWRQPVGACLATCPVF